MAPNRIEDAERHHRLTLSDVPEERGRMEDTAQEKNDGINFYNPLG
jgi:hypothetical protein